MKCYLGATPILFLKLKTRIYYIENYWYPVNTDNSLLDGLLYSCKPPYRYSTSKNEIFYV